MRIRLLTYLFGAAAMLLLPPLLAVQTAEPAADSVQPEPVQTEMTAAPAGCYRVLRTESGEIEEIPVREYLIGAVGAAIPLLILYGVYDRLIGLLLDRFGILQTVSTALPDVHAIFEGLLPVSLALGLGVGLIGSIITVRRQLRSV